ncbi:hypothetical protein GJV85_04310 [Sulfurimonas aquatica]|uniref:Uncharacterized protein n=1 Tax=Sulfurimonas aquatica TaxID=2672570 RepID=A0A975GC86_9BACT|nr:hypothetical protein [Sulfurimonas aquatica]QSZ41360.1 hypothetical protein GJV85_04310 [Sulfurimonas aquatica]
MSKKLITIISIFILSIVFLSQITLFVIQPMGAIPKGKTLVIWKLNKTNFIDSADAMCVRETGSLNILCRGMMMSAVISKSSVLMKLPYSSSLYSISTGGKEYSR